jgi:Skp family chaperone for outer membrane proteins
MAIERAQVLEHENVATHVELAALRAHPDSTPHPAELQLPELTLALRRASDKLTLAEDALRERTAQFVDMQGAASRAHYAADNAFGVAAGARAREEDALVRERELMLQLRVAEEEGRMMDRAVREYADLVRALERRQSLPSSPPPPTPPPKQAPSLDGAHTSNGKPLREDRNGRSTFESLGERKEGLHELAGEFDGTNKALNDEINRLQVELDGARSELEAERKAAEEERLRLSNALAELERSKHDDNAAAKMVSRYMYV